MHLQVSRVDYYMQNGEMLEEEGEGNQVLHCKCNAISQHRNCH